jgi:lysozyme family protein
MKVIPGSEGWPEGFEYTANGRSVRFGTEADAAGGVSPILHMKLFHPANDHYGLSPIEAAATAIDIHNTAAGWNKALLDNSARPSGALVYGNGGGRLTAEQFERLKSELETNFQGAKHAGRPLLLEGGLDWKPLSLSPRDMDFIEAKNAAAREIALAIGVPPMLLGIPGDNTYSDDPHDPGGPTNFGITLRTYATYVGRTVDASSRSSLIAGLRSIDPETVRAIYRKRYWLPSYSAELPAGLDLFHFDAAVNHGVGGATRLLQEALNVESDGEIGPITRRAFQSAKVDTVINRYAAIRERRYRALPHFWRFGRGWLNRVAATKAAAFSQRAADPAPRALNAQSKPKLTNEGVASMTDTATSTKWWGHSLTVWGAFVTAAAAILPTLGPLVGLDITSDAVRQIGSDAGAIVQAITAFVGTLMTLYGRARATAPLVRREMNVKL